MFVYMDALFRANGSDCPLNPVYGVGGLFTTDTPGIRNIPPYLLSPAMVMVAGSDGTARVFRIPFENADERDERALLRDLVSYLTTGNLTGNEACVGWYLDQVVYPVLCCAAMRLGVPTLPRWMRRLDDKWSKTMGFSLERAFFQGWYPSNRGEVKDTLYDLTLTDAVKMCGMTPAPETDASVDSVEEQQKELLIRRMVDIGNLYSRYVSASGVS